ncbi:YcgN family cysteine cluster protein [Loktanella sp. Alg231-35]|uniref:YcgN family cysteine cluster protein n=1 Tax=Loktanella sp. Alg231-35 TaxID=1922220 RepID=UPI000D54F0C3|nr:YcgN family cysteine cluster protein [Loktanella sp. Alg231-35]
MCAEIPRNGLADRFWETKPMSELNQKEWEALCDGCGKCCLNKLEDDEGTVALTRVACRLLDNESCLCANYSNRHAYVPECIVLNPDTIAKNLYWLPRTCGYRLIYEGRALYDWHPLISGDPTSVHAAGVSVKGMTVPEFDVDEDDWDDYIIEEPH